MSYWSSLPPTPNQFNAINGYNQAYGVDIKVTNKQEAHDVISAFCPVQQLNFNDKYVDGTTVMYSITNSTRFNNHNTFNHQNLKDVVNIKVENGTAFLLVKKKDSSNFLSAISRNVNRLSTETSHSEQEDSLGYLDEEDLKKELDLYGSNPMWW